MNEDAVTRRVEFGYTRFGDLFYYLLAQMPIGCAADVSDPVYAKRMAECLGITPKIPQDMIRYYQEHFDRLAIINFVPLTVGDERQCLDALASCGMLTEEDLRLFAGPLTDICAEVSGPFCRWWDLRHAGLAKEAESVYSRFCALYDRFRGFFDALPLKQRILFSYSLKKNGRAFGDPDTLNVYLPYPEKDTDLTGCFFQFLHECTHGVTDPLLERPILMADGSHDTAEHQVLIFDECLVREACPDLLAEYRRWIGEDSLAYARERLGEMGERRIGACLKRFVP